jgi:hypothetical protein
LFIRAEAWQVVGAIITSCRRPTRMNATSKQLVMELAPEAGGHLCHLLDRGQSVEASHQRVLQGRGYGQCL